MSDDARLDLYWIPLGVGPGFGPRVVRFSGRTYEALRALVERRPRCRLYHAALIATLGADRTTVEVAPIPDADGQRRGVVGEGPVGMRLLGRFRLFRYEIRRWSAGEIPDLAWAVDAPVCVSNERTDVERALDLVAQAPTPVWGRDELGGGEMWNSNSLVAWVLVRAGLLGVDRPLRPPGRAPGWDAGMRVAVRT